ncbi:hypothetical protein CPB86DRAFT_766198 [Serendipita vermifera]|nr:hypothetical protein CPB86DRAFT_766198 [Serendipita vermifera]
MSGYYGHPQPGNYPNQQFIPPQQNAYPQYTQLQYQQQPSPVFGVPPGHAAGGYFSNSHTIPAQHAVANYGQLPPTPNQQLPVAQSPVGDTSKRPLPTPIPRSRPASLVYPSNQALPTFGNQPPVSSGFIPPTNHQRNFSVDTVPTAFNAYGGAFNPPNPIPQPNGFTSRPMSMHAIPANWNVFPTGATSVPSAFNVPPVGTSAPVLPGQQQSPGRSNVPSPSIVIPNIPQTTTAGAPVSPGQPGADGKRPLPTRPPGQSQPTTPNEVPPPIPSKSPTLPNQVSSSGGKRALPASPSLPLVPPTSAARSPAIGPSGSQSLPSLSTSPAPNTSSLPAANDSTRTSSPTKRALPTAPGGGGITPGRSFTLPQPGTSTLPQQSSVKLAQPQSFKVVTMPGSSIDAPTHPPSSTRSAPTPTPADMPTSAPSSYASARSTFTPPPTGPAQSSVSDTGGKDDKRPLWKRMAAAASANGSVTGSRPRSVFGGRSFGAPSTASAASTVSATSAGGSSISGNERPTSESTPQPSHTRAASEGTKRALPQRPQHPRQDSSPARIDVGAATRAHQNATRMEPIPSSPIEKAHSDSNKMVLPQQPGGSQPSSRPQSAQERPQINVPTSAPPRPLSQPIIVPISIPETQSSSKVRQQASQFSSSFQPSTSPQNSSSSAPRAVEKHGSHHVRFSRNGSETIEQSPTRSHATPASPPRPSALKNANRGETKPVPRSQTLPYSDPRTEPAPIGNRAHSQQQLQRQIQHVPSTSSSPPSSRMVKPPAATASEPPRVSMALQFASMDIERHQNKDWAKWALVSSHDVATKPVPLTGAVERKASGRRRSASTGEVALEEETPTPLSEAGRRGSFDTSSAPKVNPPTGAPITAPVNGVRRGGARPMPSATSPIRSVEKRGEGGHSPRTGSTDYSMPQYRPSYTDSDSDEERSAPPRILIGTAPQIQVTNDDHNGNSRPPSSASSAATSSRSPAVPAINIEPDADDAPAITITVDEPKNASTSASPNVPVFSISGPEEDVPVPPSPSSKSKKKKLQKHRREKSVKEEEDERERARQLAKTRPLPPKIKKNSVRCGKCDKVILGRIVTAMNARWHPECFRCTVCETFLEHVSSYEHDDRPYCHLDYHELFAPKCYHCKTPIMEEHFITLDDEALGKRTYHEQHFFCAECGDPFLAPRQVRKTKVLANGLLEVVDQDDEVGFTVYKGHPYCEACHVRLRMPKCKKCKKSIRPGDQAIEAMNGKWCWNCFTCSRCNKPFEDPQFYEHKKQPYCQPCYSIILVNELG